MRKKTLRAISLTMAAVATLSAALSVPALAYETSSPFGFPANGVAVLPGNNGDDVPESHAISINLLSAGGQVVIDEGSEEEQRVLLEQKAPEETPDEYQVYIDVYNKDGELISQEENSEDGFYIYEYAAEAGTDVNIKALADPDYVVWKYDVAKEGVSEETGFRNEGLLEEFEFPVVADADKDVYVRFAETDIAESMLEEGVDEGDMMIPDVNIPLPETGDLTVNGDNITVNDETQDDSDISVNEEEENDPEEDSDISVNEENDPEEDSDISVDEEPGDVSALPADDDLSIDVDGADVPDDEDLSVDGEVNEEEDLNEGGDLDESGDLIVDVTPDNTEEDPGTSSTPMGDDVFVDVSGGDMEGPEDSDGDEVDTEIPDVDSEIEDPGSDLSTMPSDEEFTVRIPLSEDAQEGETEGETEEEEYVVPEGAMTSSVSVLGSSTLATGDSTSLLINAQNVSEIPAELRVYFCETEEGLSEDKAVWDVYLENAADTLKSEDLDAESGLAVSLLMSDGTSLDENFRLYWKFEGGEPVSRYAAMELPAGATADFALSVSSEEAASASLIPAIVYGEETFVYGDAVSILWQEAEVQEAPEHFLEKVAGTENLNAEKFSTARLIVLSDNADVVIDPEHMIANYGNIYLLQYGSVEQALNAYMYYSVSASAVEPDTAMEVASVEGGDISINDMGIEDIKIIEDTTALEENETPEIPEESADESAEDAENTTVPEEIMGISVTPDNNPIAMLSEEVASTEAQEESKVIALIDTGASAGPNVIDRVSLIDDVLNGGTHGDEMVKFITEQNPGAKILSIRALGNDGYGSVSAVVSAIEYAINSNVDIINLSMYSEKSLATTVLEIEIQKAIDLGITVVGSAGNDGKAVDSYVPGSIEGVWTIGAVNDQGARRTLSNFGDLVDYYVVSETTSEAAARFSGYISLFGLESALDDHTGMIFTEATDPFGNDDIDIKTDEFDTTRTDDTIYDPVIENYVKENVNPAYIEEGPLYLMNIIDVNASIVKEEDITPEDTVDTICGAGPNSKLLIQHTGRVPVYEFGSNSPYFVAYVDLMHNDSRARIVDILVGQNNILGNAIDGFYFDEETGLLYIPKEAFQGEDGNFYFDYLKAQIIYAISGFDFDSSWNSSAVVVTEEGDGEIDKNLEGNDLLVQFMDVQVGKNMDLDSMLVCVNGFPIEGNNYAYNPETGIMTIGFSSCLVQSVWVQAEKSADAPDVEPGLKAAGGAIKEDWKEPQGGRPSVSFDEMVPVSDVKCKADKDYWHKGTGMENGAGTNAFVWYNYEKGGEWSGEQVPGGSVVYPYVPSVHSTNNPGKSLYSWVGGGDPDAYPQPLQNANGDEFQYPFALKLNSLNFPHLDMSMLPSNLYLLLGCIHLYDNGYLGKDLTVNGGFLEVHLRALAVTDTYIVFAIYSDTTGSQNGIAVFKILIDDEGKGSLVVKKTLTEPKWANKSDRLVIDTQFTVYKNAECTLKYTDPTFPDGIVIDVVDTSDKKDAHTVTKTVDNIPVGTYYMKETKKCKGCVLNEKVYKFDIVADKPTNQFEVVGDGDKVSVIENTPLKVTFEIHKTDKDGKPLAGALFKVKYYKSVSDMHARKPAVAKWYFETNSNGIASYCLEDYRATYTGPKGHVYKSDEAIVTKDDPPKWRLPVGYITVEEVVAPPGYGLVDQVYERELTTTDETKENCEAVRVPETGSIENDVPGEFWKVRIQTKKIDKNGTGLAGAIFSVWKDEECEEEYVGQLTSGSDGTTDILTVDNIPETQDQITLYLKEEQAPEGYVVSDTIYKVTYEKSTWDSLAQNKKDEGGELQIVKADAYDGIPNEEGWKIRVNLKKVDEDGNLLAGAVFGLYVDILCKKLLTPEAFLTSTDTGDYSNYFSYGVSNDEEVFYLYCKEVTAPDGYGLSSEVHMLEFTKEEFDKLSEEMKEEGLTKTFGIDSVVSGSDQTYTDGIINKKGWPVRLQAKKVDQNKNGLAGAIFGIYEDDACTKLLGKITSEDPDGLTEEFSYIVPSNQDEITFYCKEIEAPEGCTPSDEIYKVTFKKSDWEALQDDEKLKGVLQFIESEDGIINEVELTPTPTLTPAPAGIQVQKASAAPAEILELHSYSLAGAEFTVYDEDGNIVGTMVTDESGHAGPVPLPDNSDPSGPKITNYTVKETKAPPGHYLSTETKPVVVMMPDDADKIFTVDFTDYPYFNEGEFDIAKFGKKGEKIQGVVFKVEFFDATSPDPSKLKRTWYLESDENGRVLFDEHHLSKRLDFKSDEFYKYGTDIVIPVDCYIQVTEVAAPAEYELDPNPTPFGYLTARDASLIPKVYNNPKPCRIRLKKYANDGVTPLEGVEFKLTFLEESVTTTSDADPAGFQRLLKVGESTILRTDKNGEVSFENLDQGLYMIEEVRTVPGQTLLKEPIYVTLPMKMTEDEANAYGNVDFGSAKLDKSYTDMYFFYDCLYEITNMPVFKLPLTGDNGRWKFGFVGIGILAAVAAWLVLYGPKGKRRNKFKI